MATDEIWSKCLAYFESILNRQDFATWLRPLQADWRADGLYLLAPNDFVLKWVGEHYFAEICKQIKMLAPTRSAEVRLVVGTKVQGVTEDKKVTVKKEFNSSLNPQFNFSSYVIGSSNELAVASAMQVCNMLGKDYNPLFLYGGVGLGKTHLMHAIGHEVISKDPKKRIKYIHAERFVNDMVKALRTNKMDQFKNEYRDVDVLLVDDIQFFANKERSQEEFFHTFNSLLDNHQQVVLSSDRFPKELSGVEDRLKSRFSWGLSVSIDPPELETRVAILMQKAAQSKVNLSQDVAFFIAENIRSNVREMEGALKRVIASAHFSGQGISLNFAQKVLGDMLIVHAKTTSVENIQKVVANYYGVKVSDLLSKSRSRSFVIPRQMAMYIARDVTTKSLPEIGKFFSGRDHTTVLYACKKISKSLKDDLALKEDLDALLKLLSL